MYDDIIKVKVARSVVRQGFPFDLFYLTPHKQLLPYLFKWSFCFPPDNYFVDTINNLFDLHICNLDKLRLMYLIVPVLPLCNTKGKPQPSYIVAAKHRDLYSNSTSYLSRKFSNLFTDRTILMTPNGPKRPCLYCTGFLTKTKAQCTFGCLRCYEFLILRNYNEQL